MFALKSAVLLVLVTFVCCLSYTKLCLEEIMYTAHFISTSKEMRGCDMFVPDIFHHSERNYVFCKAATVLGNLKHANACPSLRKQIANIESNLRGLNKMSCTIEGIKYYVKLRDFLNSLHEFASKSYEA